MIELSNDLTTMEQSKELLAIGVPAESANFYCIPYACDDGFTYLFHTYPVDEERIFPYNRFHDGTYVPIWSSGRLIEIMLVCNTGKNSKVTIEGTHSFNEKIDQLIKNMKAMLYDNPIFGKTLDFSKLDV